jgi:hypothetical protein
MIKKSMGMWRRNAAWMVGIVLGFILSGCRSSVPVGPPLERVVEWNKNPVYNTLSEEKLLQRLEKSTPVEFVYTPEERWPNGFAACMSPLMINWSESNWTDSSNRFVIVRNVQVGGNPLLGLARYATIRIPFEGVKRVELVVVRYYLKGLAKRSGHVQLRFVFEQDHRPELLNENGDLNPEQPYIDDLIISWEAWRPTNTPWKFAEGLNPEKYALTARMYSGSQRFLNDSLRGAVWDCYPLKLSGDKSAELLLWDGLVMGDLVARRSFSKLTNERFSIAEKKMHSEQIPDGYIKELLKDADTSYQALDRSCITMALSLIELTMRRVHAGDTGVERTAVSYSPGKPPAWFDHIATGEKRSIFQAIKAFFWAETHQQIFPYKSYIPLEEAGLLQTDKKGKVIMYRYGHKQGSPYGELKRNLM